MSITIDALIEPGHLRAASATGRRAFTTDYTDNTDNKKREDNLSGALRAGFLSVLSVSSVVHFFFWEASAVSARVPDTRTAPPPRVACGRCAGCRPDASSGTLRRCAADTSRRSA